jgi:hypothetical protein
LVAVGGSKSAAHCDFLEAELLACFSRERAVEPVCFFVAKQNEVNHHCQQEEKHTLRYENASWVKNQPDFVKLCHFLCSLAPGEPRQFDVRQNVSNDSYDRKDHKPAHVD